MAKPIYPAIASLDGYVADAEGKFDWAQPDEEVHAFINDLERSVGAYLYGRRMYETMAGRETRPTLAGQSERTRDFAQIWQAAEKVVYSRTLEAASTRSWPNATSTGAWSTSATVPGPEETSDDSSPEEEGLPRPARGVLERTKRR